MALIFTDPNSVGPFASFQLKDVQARVFKLDYTFFSTSGVNTKLGVLPADASILKITTWLKTAFAGNSVSSPTLSLGTASGGTQFSNAVALTNTTGTLVAHSPVTGIMQPYNVPNTTDINIWANGGCSTGNPTSGELYVYVEFVR